MWHGRNLVAAAMEARGEEALHDIVRRFRQSFKDVLQPKFMPVAWEVDHRQADLLAGCIFCYFSPRPFTECLACAGQSVSLVFIQFITYLKLSRLRAASLQVEQSTVERDVMH